MLTIQYIVLYNQFIVPVTLLETIYAYFLANSNPMREMQDNDSLKLNCYIART